MYEFERIQETMKYDLEDTGIYNHHIIVQEIEYNEDDYGGILSGHFMNDY